MHIASILEVDELKQNYTCVIQGEGEEKGGISFRANTSSYDLAVMMTYHQWIHSYHLVLHENGEYSEVGEKRH